MTRFTNWGRKELLFLLVLAFGVGYQAISSGRALSGTPRQSTNNNP